MFALTALFAPFSEIRKHLSKAIPKPESPTDAKTKPCTKTQHTETIKEIQHKITMDKILEQVPTLIKIYETVEILVDWISTPFGTMATIITTVSAGVTLWKKLSRRAR